MGHLHTCTKGTQKFVLNVCNASRKGGLTFKASICPTACSHELLFKSTINALRQLGQRFSWLLRQVSACRPGFHQSLQMQAEHPKSQNHQDVIGYHFIHSRIVDGGAYPAAQAILPQFGSCPKMADLTKEEATTDLAIFLAAALSCAPLTWTSIKQVAPSPSHAIDLASPCSKPKRLCLLYNNL